MQANQLCCQGERGLRPAPWLWHSRKRGAGRMGHLGRFCGRHDWWQGVPSRDSAGLYRRLAYRVRLTSYRTFHLPARPPSTSSCFMASATLAPLLVLFSTRLIWATAGSPCAASASCLAASSAAAAAARLSSSAYSASVPTSVGNSCQQTMQMRKRS